tara:strand:+ start:222 stop:965 length:744 start_codon:yes stop_codon:yes gene_type:complete
MVSTSKIKILIAIIAWNEEESIQEVIDGTKRLNLGDSKEYKVVVFNDSSTDNTLEIIKKNDIEVVSHPFQSGNGMFMISTYLQFAYEDNVDIVIQVDGDNQHKASYIPLICDYLISTKSNIIVGSRYLERNRFKGIAKSITNFDRLFGNFIISLALDNFLGLKISDPTSGMRAYDRKAIISLKDNSIETFDNLTFYCGVAKKGLVLREYQVDMMERDSGISEFTLLKKLVYVPSLLFSIIYILVNRR